MENTDKITTEKKEKENEMIYTIESFEKFTDMIDETASDYEQ